MRITAFAVAAAALAACSSSDSATSDPGTPATLPPAAPAPNTGSIAFVITGQQTKLYFPTSSPRKLGVAHAGAADATVGLKAYVDLGADVEPTAVGADGKDVVVVSGTLPIVYFVDARTDTVAGSAALPSDADFFPVSDNTFMASGVAVDAARRRAWVSYSGGVAEYDLDARFLTTTYASAPVENFAYDPTARRLLLPFYLCDPASLPDCVPYAQPGGPDLTDSVNVVDLVRRKVFSYVDPAAADTHAPLGFDVDGVAIDLGLGVAAVAAGGPGAVQVLELAPVYDDTRATCTMPLRLTAPLPVGHFSAITADPVTHLAMVVEESGAGVFFVDLAQAKVGTSRVLELAMPTLPDGDTWVSGGDPHGVTVGVVGGKPYAFVLGRNKTWIARIDLQQVAALATPDLVAFAGMVSYFLVPQP